MANRSKQKGTAFETQCLNYLRKYFPHSHRPALQGGSDTGDINGVLRKVSLGHKQLIFQCKNHKTWDLSGWLNATREQALNKVAHGFVGGLGVLLVKRRGVGDKNMERTYAVMELGDLVTLLQEAGYE